MNFFIPQNIKNQNILAIGILIIVALCGYYKVFLGGHVFLREDHFAISNYSYGNSLGNGWRPDKGYGISAFMGDGVWHPWSPLSWWERLIPSRTVAYNSSVILLGIMASITQFLFLRKVLPQPYYWVAVLISPLVIFGSDQGGGFHFLRLSISLLIAMPWFLMVLFDYFERPSAIHILTSALIFSFVAAFGNTWSLTVLLMLGVFFFLSYWLYFRVPFMAFMRRFIFLYGVSGCIFILLSAWFVYSLFYESLMVGYMREKVLMDFASVSFAINLRGVIDFIIAVLFADWLPVDHAIAGVGDRLFLISYNVNVIFPLVFLFFLFRKKKSFWEYALQFLVAGFLIHNFLQRSNLLGYGGLYEALSNKTARLFTMYDFIFPLEVSLIVLFISGLSEKSVIITQRWGRMLQRIVAGILFFFYMLLIAAGLLSRLSPDVLTRFVQWMIKDILLKVTHRFPYEFLDAVATYDLQRFAEVMRGHVLLYYLSSAVLVAFFLKDSWLKYAARLPKEKISLFLLVNALLMSWAVYPLSMEKPVWDNSLKEMFSPVDRFYYVRNKGEYTLDSFRKKYSQIEGGGHREHSVGLLEPPGLNLSGLKSFETKANGEFIYDTFNDDRNVRITDLRLYYGGPLFFHELLDMAAVKYYYSDTELADLPPQVTLFKKIKQLYIYKNARAWPYFYLAERLAKNEGRPLRNVKPGTAYLSGEDMFDLPRGAGQGQASLKSFSFGNMTFEVNGKSGEFIIAADSWHPFWRAKIDGRQAPVIKANQIFKGVRVPAGLHEVIFYFDTAPYKVGVYVSAVAWSVFVMALFIFRRRLWIKDIRDHRELAGSRIKQ